jgi:hypothetical protein
MSRRTEHPWLRLFVRFVGWLVSVVEDKDYPGHLSAGRVVLLMMAVGFYSHWPAEWNGPAVAALAVVAFGMAVRDLMRAIPASEALDALRAFFGNVMGKAAAAVSERAGGYYSTATAWAGSVPTSGEVLGEADLVPPVAHGRADE